MLKAKQKKGYFYFVWERMVNTQELLEKILVVGLHMKEFTVN